MTIVTFSSLAGFESYLKKIKSSILQNPLKCLQKQKGTNQAVNLMLMNDSKNI